MALESISNFCGANIPGVLYIEYLPTLWVDADVYAPRVLDHVVQGELPLREGQWLRMPVLPGGVESVWQQTQRDTPQGRSYDNQVQGTTPQLRHTVDAQFQQMPNYAYILRLTDRNGKLWLLGTLETPFYFSVSSTTGGGGGRNQYSIQFSSEQPKRVFGLVL